MTRAATLISTLLVAAPVALACGTNEAPTPASTAASAIEASPSAASPSEAIPTAEDGVPKIVSDAAVHDFGAIKPSDSIEHVFEIRNAGTANLEIERVQRT
ncbi:MAG: hypothetical protein AB1Z98_37435 [Nannocystaceae bacterium]